MHQKSRIHLKIYGWNPSKLMKSCDFAHKSRHLKVHSRDGNMARVLLTNDDSFDNDDHAHLGARKRGPGQGSKAREPCGDLFSTCAQKQQLQPPSKIVGLCWSMLVQCVPICSNEKTSKKRHCSSLKLWTTQPGRNPMAEISGTSLTSLGLGIFVENSGKFWVGWRENTVLTCFKAIYSNIM